MSWTKTVRGRVWKLGDNVDTDQILPGFAMAAPAEKLKDYALAGSPIADFAKRVKPGDIVAAGENFGCGSSREQAPVALKDAGVGLILAQSYARIFRRNAINIGLPVMVCGQTPVLAEGTEIEVDLAAARITVLETGEEIPCQVLNPSVRETLEAGGLIEKVRKQLGIS